VPETGGEGVYDDAYAAFLASENAEEQARRKEAFAKACDKRRPEDVQAYFSSLPFIIADREREIESAVTRLQQLAKAECNERLAACSACGGPQVVNTEKLYKVDVISFDFVRRGVEMPRYIKCKVCVCVCVRVCMHK